MLIKLLAIFTFSFGIGSWMSLYMFDINEKIIVPALNSNIIKRWQQEENNDTDASETTVDDVKKIRILCSIQTRPVSHAQRAIHIMETWGKHCDKVIFSSTATDVNLGAIGFNMPDSHDFTWGRFKLMFKYIYQNFIDEYDWFVKCDDDSFFYMENLRFLLSAYSPDQPITFGHKLNNTGHKYGYFAGSGFVMSRYTVRVLVEQVLTNQKFFKTNNSFCNVGNDALPEDWEISLCLDNYNVYAGDSRDLLKRNRFFLYPPVDQLINQKEHAPWYISRQFYFDDEGLDACSNYTVQFHYIMPPNQYTLYYLTYRFQPYGIKRRYPPPPRKKNFSEVARILDEERTNATLRGY